MRSRGAVSVLAVVAVSTVLTTACSADDTGPAATESSATASAPTPSVTDTTSGSTEGPTDASTDATTPDAEPYDPPVEFAAEGREIPMRIAYTVVGTTAYQYDNGGALGFDGSIDAIDLLTGEQRWSADLDEATARTLSQDARPLVAEIAGTPVVIGAVPVTVPGSGTSPDRQEIRVTGVDADSGEVRFTAGFEQPDDPTGADGALTEVAAASDSGVVVNSGGTMVLLDLETHEVRWQRPSFVGVDIEGDIVAGLDGPDPGTRTPTGLGTAGGGVVWTLDPLDDAAMYDSGPGLTQITGATPADPNVPASAIVDTASGADRAALAGRYECRYDGESVIACSDAGFLDSPGTITAYDAESVEQLWQLPAPGSDQLEVKVNAVFHGALYGSTERGSLILDARTGADRVPELPIEPVAVSEYLAVADGTTVGTDVVYPASG